MSEGWNERLDKHFAELRANREGSGLPVFALEHGLSRKEFSELSGYLIGQLKNHARLAPDWLAWVVYGAELGYDFDGQEYWSSFEHRTRSERLRLGIDDDQIDFAFEKVETGLAAIDSELDQLRRDKPKRQARPRKGFAAHLERIEEVIEPEVPEECQGLEKVLIGEDRSERLDVIPPKFRVIVIRRPKYAFRGRDGVLQALAPGDIIEGGLPSERLLAYIAVSKYADGLPLYRQETIYLRDSVVLSRSLMAQWMGHLGFELKILADYILEKIKAGERVFADETTLPTLAPGSGKTRTAWLWAYARDDRPFGGSGPPMVAYILTSIARMENG